MSSDIEDPRELSDGELRTRYRAALGRTTPDAANLYIDELRRREAVEQNRRIEDMTRTVRNLTWVLVALTVVLIVLGVAALVVAGR